MIESANVRYAEINLDGNVHFIGTQGVGKSPLLRALLFFYNANQQKLGIPIGKKSFVDFYFAYPNSYIIYEVSRETGAYCIFLSKSQGRVSYRFINSGYKRDYFIGDDWNIHENWDKIRTALGKDRIASSNKIDRYEDYRNILYGNSQTLGAEFRKYSLLESKQYQNIPRAIQHVFLNYKVESEFIKDTIIKSINEDEIKIDLSNYSHHLKDFEAQLGDIKKWTEKTRSGENLVHKQAETVISTHDAIKFNQNEIRVLAAELVWRLANIQKSHPQILEKYENEKSKQTLLTKKLNEIEGVFQNKKDRTTAEINIYNGKLKDAKTKSEEYALLNIESIIKRVSKRTDLESEIENLNKQKALLESNFLDIKQKFEAQINQFQNQFVAFENSKQLEINNKNQNLFLLQETQTKEYDKLFDEIRKQNQDKLQIAKNLVEDIKTTISNLQIKKAKIQHQRFYETEIEELQSDKLGFLEKIRISKSETLQNNLEIETIKKQWELENEKLETSIVNQKDRINDEVILKTKQIANYHSKIKNSRNSLYGWLNEKYPNWEKTIGKVIDEENVLFRPDLSPELISTAESTMFGIKLDFNNISKSVKTVVDYENEILDLSKKIESKQVEINSVDSKFLTTLDSIRKRFQPKISKCKDAIRMNEYDVDQNGVKLNNTIIKLDELQLQATEEKQMTLSRIQKEIDLANTEKVNSEIDLEGVTNEILREIDLKKKEKNKKIKAEQINVGYLIDEIKTLVAIQKKETKRKTDELELQKKQELNNEGADTVRISNLEIRINDLKLELEFIELHRDKVVEFNKDKKELFDQVDYFKNQKAALEKQIITELLRHDQKKHKLKQEIDLVNEEIKIIKSQLNSHDEDFQEYITFRLTDCYNSIPELLEEPNDSNNSERRCKSLIAELNGKYYGGIQKFTDLQASINKFNGNFSAQNIFKFKTNLIEREAYFQFSEDLKEFVEEDKISIFEKRFNALFADIIRQIGKETTDLMSKEGEIEKVILDINSDFVRKIFTGVIRSIALRVVPSENKIVHLLAEIKKFNDENIHEIGMSNLFSSNEQTRETKNKEAIRLLSLLTAEIDKYKHNAINLSDSFELEFKVIENDNDTNWVQSLANVGSNGTDVLVKAMINIMLLNVFKEGATKNKFNDFRLHCMVDEIGTLHIENVRGLLKFANDRNIFILNGSPQSMDALAFRYTYKLAKQTDLRDGKPVTMITRLITNNRDRPEKMGYSEQN